jgi:putative colanic acid biosynthesis acetyltransferase WcaF
LQRSETIGLWQAVWFLLGCPLLKSGVIPFSGFRVWLLRLFGATVGEGVVIKPGVRVKNPWRLFVGNDCWIGEDCWIDNIGDVIINDDVCVSQGAYLCTGNHDWSDTSFGLIVKPIRLERGSWVGARALIAPGVSLGQCAVAAAGSVVQKNVPAFEIHSGNPAGFLRLRKFSVMRNERVAASEPVAPEPDAARVISSRA